MEIITFLYSHNDHFNWTVALGHSHVTRNRVSTDLLCCMGPSRSWPYGSWINNYICNQCLSPITMWVRIPLRRCELDTSLCGRSVVCSGTPVSSTNKTDRDEIIEILLTVAVSTINLIYLILLGHNCKWELVGDLILIRKLHIFLIVIAVYVNTLNSFYFKEQRESSHILDR